MFHHFLNFFGLFLLAALALANPAPSLKAGNGVHQLTMKKLGKEKTLLKDGGFKLLDQIHAKRQRIRQMKALKDDNGGDNGQIYHHNIYDYYDLLYVSEICIGNPPQEFTVVLDTGSANLWVVDKSCDGTQDCDPWCDDFNYCFNSCDFRCCGWDDGKCACDNKQKFDSSKSKSYKKDGRKFSIHYGIGFADGFLGNDSVKFGGLGDKDSLLVPGVTFGQATTIDRQAGDDPIDGILGLAFQSIAVDNVEPPMMAAIRQGLLAQPVFTVFLETDGSQALNQGGGTFTYGGLDTQNCGKVQGYAPLTDETFYQFQIDGVSAGKYKSTKKAQVVSDTGTSLIIGDSEVVKNCAKQIGAQYNAQYGLYLIPCNKQYDPITFTINGQQYSLPQEVLTFDIVDDSHETCLFGMLPYDFDPAEGINWILGDPFIRQYCNVHDIGNQRMGFAPSIQPKMKKN